MMMTPMLDTDKAWRAVLTRDRRADGAFVYAVRSTGIYCRPSCPSRRPARRNVRFYRDPAGAESEGFRPCRRCGEAVAPQRRRDLELVRRVCEVLGDNGAEAMPLNRLAAACRTSPFALRRTFKRVTGVSPRAYAEALRFRLLKRALRKERTVSAATFVAGFGSCSRLYERAADRLGMTPAAYRLGATGTEIRFSLISTTLGTALVGGNPARGLRSQARLLGS
jgi:AraC family transcriptional regulator of adaptative response/methylated-DNA-[protein]-cysteine methyltransferase